MSLRHLSLPIVVIYRHLQSWLLVHQQYSTTFINRRSFPLPFINRIPETLRWLSNHTKVLQTLTITDEERSQGTWSHYLHVQSRVHSEEWCRRRSLHGRVSYLPVDPITHSLTLHSSLQLLIRHLLSTGKQSGGFDPREQLLGEFWRCQTWQHCRPLLPDLRRLQLRRPELVEQEPRLHGPLDSSESWLCDSIQCQLRPEHSLHIPSIALAQSVPAE